MNLLPRYHAPDPRLGYRFEGTGGADRWSAVAVPRCAVCMKGARSFHADESGIIRCSTTGVAGPESPEVGG